MLCYCKYYRAHLPRINPPINLFTNRPQKAQWPISQSGLITERGSLNNKMTARLSFCSDQNKTTVLTGGQKVWFHCTLIYA